MTSRSNLFPALFALVAACSIAPEGTTVHDPFEDHNRQIHAFNKSVAARFSAGDDDSGPTIPPQISARVINMADNLSLPGAIVNNLLQADVLGAGQNAARMLINTTIGLGGLFDPADEMGVTEVKADFGGTLAVWGAPEGAYMEWPLIGPRTERHAAGTVVDAFLNPLGSFLSTEQAQLATGIGLAGTIAKIDQSSGVIDDVLNESADSYAQTRLIYLQNRRFDLGQDDPAAVDPYDELFGDLQ